MFIIVNKELIPNVIQKLAFLAARKSPRIEHYKLVSIINTNQLAMFDPRGFGALETPTFESRSVYTERNSNVGIFSCVKILADRRS